MFRVHHGLQDDWLAPGVADVLHIVEKLLVTGKTNVLVTRADCPVTGHNSPPASDDSIMTLVLEVTVK
jgi:hypothetical protein